MTKEKEIKLLKDYKKGDREATDKLGTEATRLGLAIAGFYYKKPSKKYPEAVYHAVSGFYEAISPYFKNSRDKTDKFTTYATWFMRKNIEDKMNTTKKLTE